MWGIDITEESDASTVLLLKFLRAADVSVDRAVERLAATLRFRAEHGVEAFIHEPLAEHFEGHDALTGTDVDGRPLMISRYGAMDNDRVFGDTEAFVRYRVHIMERAMRLLRFERGAPENLCQVHDYTGVPLLFKTNEVKQCVTAMSKVFSEHYPETKGKTIFVNFPTAFSKLFQAFSVFLPAETRRKFLILGESDQALLFQYLKPEVVPEDLGGMLRAGSQQVTPCQMVPVPPRSSQEVVLTEVAEPATLHWELRVCSREVDYELFFKPCADGTESLIRASSSAKPLQAADGVVSGEFRAPAAGSLLCRFRNDKAWFQSRLCLCRAVEA